MLRQGLTWVLTRIKMEIDEYPLHQQELSVETWPSGLEKMSLFRDFYLRNQFGKIIGKATFKYVVLDFKARKVVEIPDFIRNIPLPDKEPALPHPSDIIPDLGDASEAQHFFRATWHDIDINNHINNLSYIRWVIDSTPVAVLKQMNLKEIDLVFKAESKLNTEITGMVKNEVEDTFLYKLVRNVDQKTLVMARCSWN